MQKLEVVLPQVVGPALIGETLDDLTIVADLAPRALVLNNELRLDGPPSVVVPIANHSVRAVATHGVM